MHLPMALALELHPGDVTASTWRIALALLSKYRGGQEYYTHKPGIAALAGVRMDNADRLLTPVRTMVDADGQPIFESITYERGRQKRDAGQITVTLTDAGIMLLRGQPIEIPDDELPQYSIATAMTLRLRIGAEHARVGGKTHHWRLNSSSAVDLLGTPVARAGAIAVAKSGEQYETVSLSRAWKNAIKPAVDQINGVCRDFRIIPTITRQTEVAGSPWISVDLDVHRVAAEKFRTPVRKSLRELGQDQARRQAYLARVRETG